MEKELNIIPPIGYEIDKQKSTFEKIIFSKIEPCKPTTWEEYYEQTKNRTYYTCICCCESHVGETAAHGFYGEFSTKERVKQYVALGKLLQLRDYWVGDWKINPESLDNVYVVHNNMDKITEIDIVYYENYPLTFPTKENAKEFIDCFSDLIKQAYPLV